MSQTDDWQIPGDGFDIYHTVFVRGMLGPWAPRVLALAAPESGERVVDVACGTGVVTRLAAAAVGPEGHVSGVDISPEMLEVARRPADGDAGAAAIDWREAAAERLPFEDEVFDVALCQAGLMFFDDRPQALAELLRVLAPGGRVAILVWGAMERSPGQQAMYRAWLRAYGPESVDLFETQHSLGDPGQVQALLAGAGFEQVTVTVRLGAVHLASAEQLARGYGAMMEMPAEPASAIVEDVSAALASYSGPDGLAYPIEAVLASARKG